MVEFDYISIMQNESHCKTDYLLHMVLNLLELYYN